MKHKKVIYYILAIIGIIILSQMTAQNKPRQWDDYVYFNLPDTLRQDTFKPKVVVSQAMLKPGSPEYIDSMKRARQQYVDSLKKSQAAYQDSLNKERKRVADSTILANKKYNDSVRTVLAAERAERQRIADSAKLVQQARKDSLDRLKAYRESKAFKDSVATVKQARLDSIATVRKHRADSMAIVRTKMKDSLATLRKKMQDSMAVERKRIQDSIGVVRKQYQDSIKIVIDDQKAKNLALKDSITALRAFRTDSLAKAKVAREAATLKRYKDREKAKNAKMRDKEKKKREAYTNESMRKKKWSLWRRTFQNTTTHYNYHFNAKERLRLVEENMVKNNVNQYDSLLPLFPFDPDKDSTKYAADLDSIIRKASIGIHIHDPRSKWQDNIYLVVGKAYYYKGDYKNAASAFKYIVANAELEKKEKEKKDRAKGKKKERVISDLADETNKNLFLHQTSKNEAVMWLARTLAQDSQVNLAQTVLNMLKSSKQFNAELLAGKYATAQSFVDIKNGNYAAAISDLTPITEDNTSPDWLRQRAAYLRGQLLQNDGKYLASDSAFDKVIALKPALEMDFYAKMNKVSNSIAAGKTDNKGMLASLQRMSKETKYKDYNDRIYFAQARLYESNNDTLMAIEHYQKSVNSQSKSAVQKGLSFAGLGNIYYVKNDYNAAKKSYDSALAFLTEAQNPTFAIAQQRAGALDYIADPGNTVKYTDSILVLANMSEKDQAANARKYIRALEKSMLDSFYNAKNSTATAALPAPTSLSSSKQSWYFGNPSTVQQGINAFKQKWGNRELKDDWNRSTKTMSSGGMDDDDNSNLSDEDKLRATLPTEADLLALIPRGTKAIDSANKVLEKAIYELGVGFYKHMADMPMAIKTFDDLDKRFPTHPYAAEILYYRYIIALNNNEKSKAESYQSELLLKYADSDWAKMVKSAQQNEKTASNADMKIEQHYEETYNALILQDYSKAYRDAEAAPALYPKEIKKYEKKYLLVKYAAIAGNKEYALADSLLNIFVSQNATDETVQWAKDLQLYVKGKIAAQPKDTIQKSNNGPIVLPPDSTLVYTYMPNNLHYVMVSCPVTDNRINGLRPALREYNNSKANRKALEVSLTQLDANRSIVVVQEFKNAQEAKKYRDEIAKISALFKEFSNPGDYEIITISNDNIIKLYTDKDWTTYQIFYNQNYK